MLPAQPPFPTAKYFPFQPDAGIQTSIFMSESLEGFSVAATRQNAGSCRKAAFCWAPPAPGGVNPPGATDCANVIAVFSTESDLRLSQETISAVAGAGIALKSTSAKKTRLPFRNIKCVTPIGSQDCADSRKR